MDDTVAAAASPTQADHRFAAVTRGAACRSILSCRAARRQRLPDPTPGGAPNLPPSTAHLSFPASAYRTAVRTAVPAVPPGSARNTPTRRLTTRNPR